MTYKTFKRIFWGNFAAFILLTLIFGGDALNGYVSGGKYFLVEHGNRTKVSAVSYYFSLVHGVITFGSFIVLVIGSLILRALGKKPEQLFKEQPDSVDTE